MCQTDTFYLPADEIGDFFFPRFIFLPNGSINITDFPTFILGNQFYLTFNLSAPADTVCANFGEQTQYSQQVNTRSRVIPIF